MLFHEIELQDVDQNITRPVVMDIGRQLSEIMKFPKGLEISYIAQGEARHQFGSTIGVAEPEVKTANTRMLSIEATSEFDESQFSGQAAHRLEHEPIFLDGPLGVIVKPIYQDCKVTLNVEYKTPNRNEAVRWQKDASFKVSQLRNVILQTATYCWLLPNPLWTAMAEIYKLREGQAGYGDTFPQYMEKHLSPLATRIADSTGRFSGIGVRESQMEIQGFFDFTSQPAQQERDGDSGAWIVRFGYEFSFSCPIKISLQMPIVIHNQPVAQKFIPIVENKHAEYAQRVSLSKGGFMMYAAYTEMDQHKPVIRRFNWPTYDYWSPDKLPRDMAIVASFLIGLSKTDTDQVLLNLNDLGQYALQDSILQWIKAAEYPYLGVPRASPLQIAVYRNECLTGYQTVEVQPNLDVVLKQPVDLRKRYRVVLLLNKQLTQCDPSGVGRLAQHPEAMRTVLRTIRATKGALYRFTPHLDLRQFEDACEVGGPSYQDVVDHIVSMKVQSSGKIEAHRLSDKGTLI